MRRAIAVLALLLAGVSLASTIDVSGPVSGKPGDVIAIPYATTGPGQVSARGSDGLVVLGAVPDPKQADRGIVTVLIDMSALAGRHQVTLELTGPGGTPASTTVPVTVEQVAGLAVSVSGPSTIVAGSRAHYTVLVENTGNGNDTFELSALTTDSAKLSEGSVTLGPHASAKVQLTISPVSFGRRIVSVTTRSGVDPSVHDLELIEYRVLAFGSTNPNAPSLAYSLPLGASYGSSGFSYFGGLSGGGPLSSIISTSQSFAVEPGGHSASLALFGDAWSVVYGYDSQSGHQLTASYRDVTASGTLDQSGALSTGISYASGSWTVSYDHTWGPRATDALSAGYPVSLAPNVILTPSIGLAGEVHVDGTYHVSPLAAFSVAWNGPVAIIRGSSTIAPWTSTPWQVNLAGYSRQIVPLAVTASVHASPAGYDGTLSVTETPNDRVTLAQQLTYASGGPLAGQFGVQLDPIGAPVRIVSVVNANLSSTGLTTTAVVSANVTRLPWIATISASVDPGVTLSYGQSYIAPDFALSGSIALPLGPSFAPLLGLRGTYSNGTVSVGAGASYDVGSSSLASSASLGLQILPQLAIQGTTGYSAQSGFTWKVGASATLSGGFAVPTPIVNAFGGLDVGTVTGVIKEKMATGTVPAAGITVSVPDAGRSTKTAADGSYTLALRPGTYTLTFPGLSPQLALPEDTSVTIRRQKTVRKDLTLVASYAISGQVYVDVDGVGHPTTHSYGLAGVSVHLTGPSGERKTATTDDTGSFVFRDLKLGAYRVSIGSLGNTHGLEAPARPTAVQLTNDHGLAYISIGLTRVKPTVTTTLGGGRGSLALSVDIQPAQAPPTALIHVKATSQGASSAYAAFGGGTPVALAATQPGVFEGDIAVPASARGVAVLTVKASSPDAQAEQTTMVFVTNAALATLDVEPGYAEPGTTVQLVAHLLVAARSVHTVVQGVPVPMQLTKDRTYVGTLQAPAKPGPYQLELDVDGKVLVRKTLTVTAH